jgi:hypothetical protein
MRQPLGFQKGMFSCRGHTIPGGNCLRGTIQAASTLASDCPCHDGRGDGLLDDEERPNDSPEQHQRSSSYAAVAC